MSPYQMGEMVARNTLAIEGLPAAIQQSETLGGTRGPKTLWHTGYRNAVASYMEDAWS